jgi:vacuolar-type H+-ATPase subunit E/Vma4
MMTELGPLSEQLTKASDAATAQVLQDAEDQAVAIADEAREEAERRRDEARRQGLATADQHARQSLVAARRSAARLILAQRQAAIDELRSSCLEAVMGLREDPGYSELEDRLTEVAQATLGDSCEIERDPDRSGGVLASTETRLVDLTLPALVDECLDRIGIEIEEMWRD